MVKIITREAAWELLRKYNKDPFHLQHALTVEGVMRWYAEQLGFASEVDFWGMVGLLHDMVLFATDELTGLIWAAALMRPSKSVQDMELKSLKKKYKSKGFAAGCSREVIEQGAEMLGCPLDEVLQKTIDAMRDCETRVASEMEKI